MGSDGKLGEGHVGFEITMEHAERRPGGRGQLGSELRRRSWAGLE